MKLFVYSYLSFAVFAGECEDENGSDTKSDNDSKSDNDKSMTMTKAITIFVTTLGDISSQGRTLSYSFNWRLLICGDMYLH